MSHQVIENLRTAIESFLTQLRAGDGFNREDFDRVCGALQACLEVWSEADSIPKELANILLDLWPGIEGTASFYDEAVASDIMQAADKIADLSRQICSTSDT